VILSVLYDAPYVAVDTHVHRVSNRIGLVKTKMPEQTDKALDVVFTTEQKKKAHHAMVLFGRYVCVARKPKCEICKLQNFCSYFNKK
jgi:endonuclease-3